VKLKNYLGLQEGGAVNFIIPDAKGLSYHVGLGRVAEPGEMMKVGALAKELGLSPANTADGVTLLNLAEDATAESATRMRPKIEQFVREIGSDAKLTRVRHQSVYVDSSKLLAKENEGLGKATDDLLTTLKVLEKLDPKAHSNIIHNIDIQKKAADNILRLREYDGLGQRIDAEKALGKVANDGLRGLKDYVKEHGSKGLPAVAGGAAVPVIRGDDSSTNEP
jgi:hypothetical protein